MKIILLCVVSSYVLYGAESYNLPDPVTIPDAKSALQHLNGGVVPGFNDVADSSSSGASNQIVRQDLNVMNDEQDPLTSGQIGLLFNFMATRASPFLQVTMTDWNIIYA